MKVKKESEKVGLKLNIQKTKIMENKWGNNGNWETSFWGKWGALESLQMVTAAMKLRHLPLRRKAMTNLDSMLKSRDITLSIKDCLVKDMTFPVVMCRCEI